MARTSGKGECQVCGAILRMGAMGRHVAEHLKVGDGPPGPVFLIRVDGGEPYWLHVAAKANATLRDLDQLLRDTWLECCDHLSAFDVDGDAYASSTRIAGWGRPMEMQLRDVLRPGISFGHEYDLGSTTWSSLSVLEVLGDGRWPEPVSVLARNLAPEFECVECGRHAAWTCTLCDGGGGGAWLCADCASMHDCGEDHLLPVTNSPRCGICGYVGEALGGTGTGRSPKDDGTPRGVDLQDLAMEVAAEVDGLRGKKGEADDLLSMLGEANLPGRFDRDPWGGWMERTWVYAPVVERLVELGPPSVSAILDTVLPPATWVGPLVARTLGGLIASGRADGRLDECLEWLLRNSPDQWDDYYTEMGRAFGAAGNGAEGALRRFLMDWAKLDHSIPVGGHLLEEADSGWACPLAEEVTRRLMNRPGTLEYAARFSRTAAIVCGSKAKPLIEEIVDRYSQRDEFAFQELELWEAFRILGLPRESTGLDLPPDRLMEAYYQTTHRGGDVSAAREGVAPADRWLFDDMLSLLLGDLESEELPKLALACRNLDLDPSGGKAELVERLERRFREEPWGDGLVTLREAEAMSIEEVRRESDRRGLPTVGGKGAMVERLLDHIGKYPRSRAEERRVYPRWELEEMGVDRLREILRGMGLDTRGKRRALIARIQMGQDDQP